MRLVTLNERQTCERLVCHWETLRESEDFLGVPLIAGMLPSLVSLLTAALMSRLTEEGT